jgi:hypothetical protein
LSAYPVVLRAAACLTLLLLLGLSGCGKSGATITGEVNYKGKRVPSGRVTFYDAEGKVARQSGIRDGKYTITDFPPGEATITVQTPRPAGKAIAPKGLKVSASGGQAGAAAAEPVAIPSKYGKRQDTPLRYTVKPGEQSHDITLE